MGELRNAIFNEIVKNFESDTDYKLVFGRPIKMYLHNRLICQIRIDTLSNEISVWKVSEHTFSKFGNPQTFFQGYPVKFFPLAIASSINDLFSFLRSEEFLR
jgi:hypothetical protein